MQALPAFDPSLAISGDINVNAADAGCKVLLYNLSIYALELNFEDGQTAILHAGEANWWELNDPTPTLQWTQYSKLNVNPSGVAISQVTVTLYRQDETIEGTYPIFSSYQLLIGNTVNTIMGGSTTLQNDNNISGTQVYESQVSGSPGSNVIMQNQGLVEVLQWVGGVLTQIFKTDPGAASVVKLANSGLLTEVLGTLKVSGVAEFVSNILEDNSISLQWKDSGGIARTVLQVDGFNNTQIFGITGNDKVQFLKSDGTLQGFWDLINAILNITGVTQNATGDGGGTMSVVEILGGPLKIVLLKQNNYKQAGGAQMITLKNAFTFLAFIVNAGCGGISVASGGGPSNIGEMTWGTGTAGGTSATVTTLNTTAAGFSSGAFTQIGTQGGYVGPHTGISIFIGQ